MLLLVYVLSCLLIFTSSVEIRINGTVSLSVSGTSLNTGLVSEYVRKIRITKYIQNEDQIEYIENFPYVKEIDIISSGQESMPIFRNLPNIKQIQIRRHDFFLLKKESLSHVPVWYLYLDNNQFYKIENNAIGKSVKILSVKCNNLKTFDVKWFEDTSTLDSLDISGNQIKVLQSGAFKPFPSLINILIRHNNMTEIGYGAFGNRNDFTWVEMDQNKLRELPSSVFKNGRLSFYWFWLTYNEMSFLPDDLLDRITVTGSVRLHGNPWQCSCYLGKIGKTFTNIERDFLVEGDPSCVKSLKFDENKCVNEVDEEMIKHYVDNSVGYTYNLWNHCHKDWVWKRDL